MKDQIVKIIADYLNKMEVPKEKWDGTVGFFPAEWPLPTRTIADEIAEKIAAAIAPHLEAGAGEQAIKACKIVVDGYEGDGMENMAERDNVFYRECKKACTYIS